MSWTILKDETGLTEIKKKSSLQPQVIYKHSTRCGVSSMVRNRLERSGLPGHIDFHFLDLIAHRSLSDKIAHDFSIRHESPQVLLIKDGKCIYDESHYAISMDEIIEKAG
jgi:bacillithiol system protein YtxJ